MPISEMPSINKPKNKIKVVSKQSGVPTPTLRIWESRYKAFTPDRTPSGQRIYSDEDLLKATLLRRLTESGQPISAIAALDNSQLKDLVLTLQSSDNSSEALDAGHRSASVVVVGLNLASRLESRRFKLSDASTKLLIEEVFVDLETAIHSAPNRIAKVLMIHVNSLHVDTKALIDTLIHQTQPARIIVLYNFGQQQVVEWMKSTGITVRREPISDLELLDLVESTLLVDARKTASLMPASAVIPARRYSDEGLQAIARISTDVLCECPRHVAEIIGMLCNFEQYSQECLNKSSEDAHLHALLKSVAGSSRAMFERAMESVAAHEGINLNPFKTNEDLI